MGPRPEGFEVVTKIRLSPRSQLQRLKVTNSQPSRLLLVCVRFRGLLRRMSKPQRSITNDNPLIQGASLKGNNNRSPPCTSAVFNHEHTSQFRPPWLRVTRRR